jgi:hypothetical protein
MDPHDNNMCVEVVPVSNMTGSPGLALLEEVGWVLAWGIDMRLHDKCLSGHGHPNPSR